MVPTFRSLTDNAILQIMFRLGMHVSTHLNCNFPNCIQKDTFNIALPDQLGLKENM